MSRYAHKAVYRAKGNHLWRTVAAAIVALSCLAAPAVAAVPASMVPIAAETQTKRHAAAAKPTSSPAAATGDSADHDTTSPTNPTDPDTPDLATVVHPGNRDINTGKDGKGYAFTTLWADNNAASRPSPETLTNASEYQLYFTVDEGTDEQKAVKYPLTEKDGVTVSEQAKKLLGIDQAYFDKYIAVTYQTADGKEAKRGPVEVERTGVGEYEASVKTSTLPSGVWTWNQSTNDDGTPKTDEHGNPVFPEYNPDNPGATSPAKQVAVRWYIGHATATSHADLYPQGDGQDANPTYRAADGATYPKYVKAYEKECLQLLQDVSFNVVAKFGDEKLDDPATWTSNQTITVKKNGAADPDFGTTGDNTISMDADDLREAGSLPITLHPKDGSDAGCAPITSPAAANKSTTNKATATCAYDKATYGTMRWPQYHPDGTPLTYMLSQDEAKTGEKDPKTGITYYDYRQVWYDNTASSNHGSDTSVLFNGGTVTVTHAGTTSYDGTKVWLDDDASKRPATTYSLWRYSAKPGAKSTTAAQVTVKDKNDNDSYVTLDMSAAENREVASGEGIDLGSRLRDKYGERLNDLPKYDQDGYPYIYLLREDVPDGYERVFGEVQADGSVSDTAPNYYRPKRADGTTTWSGANGSRPTATDGEYNYNDVSVYNGGTVTNRRVGTVTAGITKTWKAASFQDQLDDVTVTFQAKRILKKNATFDEKTQRWVANDGASWQDVPESSHQGEPDAEGKSETIYDADSGVRRITDWSAERLTQSLEGTFPKYDAHGDEYVYQWVESGVSKPGQTVDFQPNAESLGGTFQLTLKNSSGQPTVLDFTGSWDAKDRRIVNEYTGVTRAQIDKFWCVTAAGDGDCGDPADGGSGWTQDAQPYGKATSITVELLQGDTSVGEFTLDGVADGKDTTFRIKGADHDSTARETSPWHMEFSNLPEYDADGRRYTYLVLEKPVDGFTVSRVVDEKANTTKIYNTPITGGEINDVPITKEWIDDGDAASRKPVKVKLLANVDVSDANGTVRYPAGTQIGGDIELNQGNSWFTKRRLDVGHVREADGTVRKLDWRTDLRLEEVGTDDYEMIAKDDPRLAESPYSVLRLNWNDDNPRLVAKHIGADVSDDFAYEVTYGINKAKSALQVTNRRIGQVSIEIDKTWNDAGIPDADKAKRPAANFIVKAGNKAVTFGTDAAGNVTQTVTGGDVPYTLNLYKDADAEGSDYVKLNVNDGSVRVVDTQTLEFTVDVSQDESWYDVFGLTKYDETGMVVPYSVSEAWDGDCKTDGSSSAGSAGDANPVVCGEYTRSQTAYDEQYLSDWHFDDRLNISFANTRTGVKDVTFHTHWFDAYVKEELNQRIDVYLTLYRAVYAYDRITGELKTDPATGQPVIDHLEPVGEYEDYRWTPETLGGDSTDPNYERQATIRNLPKYDEHGKEIVYFASARTSVSGDAVNNLDYLPHNITEEYFDKSASSAEVKQITGDQAKQWVGTDAQTGTGGDRGFAIREDGTFNFHISSGITGRGTKLWTNVPGNVDQADLPAISVYAQRRLAPVTYVNDQWTADAKTAWNGLTITAADGDGGANGAAGGAGYHVRSYVDVSGGEAAGKSVADGTTAVAWTRDIHKVSDNAYVYTLYTYGDNAYQESAPAASANDLPRYDEYGRRYEYRTREVMDGLIRPGSGTADTSLPGGFDVSDILSGGASAVSPEDAVRKVYKVNHGETGSFALENVYNPDKGELTVRKSFDGVNRADGDKYPDVTFELWRYYYGKDPATGAFTLKRDAALVTTKTVDGKTFAAGGDDVAGSAGVTFADLPIYAPNGRKWLYYVREVAPEHGYACQVTVGGGAAGASVRADGTGTTALCGDEQAAVELTSAATQVTAAAGLGSDGANGSAAARRFRPAAVLQTGAADLSVGNTYGPDQLNLAVTKTWVDSFNGFDTRPTAAKFLKGLTVERRSTTGSAQTEKVTLQTGDATAANYATVTDDGAVEKTDTEQAWVIHIHNVERWAPDGSAWQYVLTETMPDGYGNSRGDETVTVPVPDDIATVPTVEFSGWRNTFKGKVSVHKVWADGDDQYGLRPTAVRVMLQAKVDGQTAWNNAHTAIRAWLESNGYSSSEVTEDVMKHMEHLSGTGGAYSNLNVGNSWTQVWWDLPLFIRSKDGATTKTVSYRVVEVGIGENSKEDYQTLPEVTGDDLANAHSGVLPYTPSYEIKSEASGSYSQTTETITNTLVPVTIYGSKTWEDNDNQGKTRPGTSDASDTWTATFRLQRRIGDGDWQWVVKPGNPAAASGFDASVAVATITGTKDSAAKTFDHLPKTDTAGKAYTYRLVEEVPSRYVVTDGTLVETGTGDHAGRQLVTVAGDAMDQAKPQAFTNKLSTVDVWAVKEWMHHGVGIAPKFGDLVDADPNEPGLQLDPSVVAFVLQRREKCEPKGCVPAAWQNVTKADGSALLPTVTEIVLNEEMAKYMSQWKLSYGDLPAKSAGGATYEYRIVETSGKNGFVTLYGSNGRDTEPGVATSDGNGGLRSPTIFNKATMLQILKEDVETGDRLAGAEFTIQPKPTPEGTPDEERNMFADGSDSPKTLVTDEDGYAGLTGLLVVGKTYQITEVKAPGGYAKLTGTIDITPNANGNFTIDDNTAKDENGESLVEIEGNVDRDAVVDVFVENQKADTVAAIPMTGGRPAGDWLVAGGVLAALAAVGVMATYVLRRRKGLTA
ncbi:Cna B-type domain-containing protein [Bifidobacterium leontopitheci]|uniref:Cell surface CnaB domain-containing protein n=1 Tax=Bifidobacterium leontopitheci TaxID=2650774 RepID=A0A6I1GE40_9BIFI|nr:Cna B-type domain-containing protein [Bifidobacterium leontopitheci]KAB7789903.1 cell surface CnaB domain-containing protein [Bifidobacterium leontopitheci]